MLDYFGRYTHRVALSNDRILKVEKGQVTFSYRDRSHGEQKKILTLEAQEFIRRFLPLVLPEGFMRIRHFDFLANRSKKHALASMLQTPETQSRFARNPQPISPGSYVRTHRHRSFPLPLLPEGNDYRGR